MLHLETQTPLRNGRKRVLRKSLRSSLRGTAASTQSSDSAPSQQVSPLPKHQCLEKPRNKTMSASKTKTATEKKQSSGSPSGSSTSSLKENTKPAAERTPYKAQQASSRRSSLISGSSTPLNRTLTRHSARRQRKRLSQEMSMTEGHLKVSTPKRVRQEQQQAGSKEAGEDHRGANRSRSKCVVRIATMHTRAVAAEAAPVAARTRRK